MFSNVNSKPGIGKMQNHPSITRSRLDLFLSEGNQFTDVNLPPHLYKRRLNDKNNVKLTHYAVPDLKRIPFNEAISNQFKPTQLGASFGPSWSTHWYEVNLKVPEDWVGEEVQFRFNANSEVLIFSKDGHPIQALTGEGGGNQRLDYVLTRDSKGGETYSFYLEMACNGLFGNGPYLIGPPEERTYTISMAELSVPNLDVFGLKYDFEVISAMAKELPDKSSRKERALRVANKIMNLFPRDAGTNKKAVLECRKVAQEYLSYKGPPNGHKLIAVGHCHIDTAWLWPFDETKRKVARSWATQINLMDLYPDFTFVCSQAQQFEWLELNYPTLFKKVQEKSRQDQFLPIGGTWVEMDCNVPSGEAFCRQFLLGQRYFQHKFGKRCKIFWLPDTFGYSAQLPQIVKEADLQYFFTQKLSWNNINKFPNTTFFWVGLDGTRVLAHMAPGETYGAQGTPNELLFSESNNKNKSVINQGLYLYGNGDGGGGPLPVMIERINRMKDVEGLPKLEMGNADAFYDSIAQHPEVEDLPEWNGELYLELHRGTYTSHASIKRNNRHCELLLQAVEKLWTLVRVTKGEKYPTEELTHLWKLVCLNQFHDVLPGSSIAIVYQDAEKFYAEVKQEASELIEQALDILNQSDSSSSIKNLDVDTSIQVFNPLPWSRQEIVKVDVASNFTSANIQKLSTNQAYVLTNELEGFGVNSVDMNNSIKALESQVHIYHKTAENMYILENAFIKATFNSNGHLISLTDRATQREVLLEGQPANVFKVYEDVPLYWDAWDVEVYHLEKFDTFSASSVEIEESGPLVASLRIVTPLSTKSQIVQIVKLTGLSQYLEFETIVDWDENRKMLKVEFPTNIISDHATYETQFGVIRRQTHFNTTWDLAKFEICSHKFADLSQADFGLSVINDGKYGFATHNNVMRLSLLRSPKSPDPNTDIGRHEFRYALYPHRGTFNQSSVVKHAHNFNNPLQHKFSPSSTITTQENKKQITSLFNFNSTTAILDTVKISEDNQNDVVIRIYEAYGAQTKVDLDVKFKFNKAFRSNILEDELEPFYPSNVSDQKDSINFKFSMTPFQIFTLKFKISNL